MRFIKLAFVAAIRDFSDQADRPLQQHISQRPCIARRFSTAANLVAASRTGR
jgi:hypothetical protein